MSLLSPLRSVGGTQAVDIGALSLGRPSNQGRPCSIDILPRATACIRVRLEAPPSIAFDLGPGPALGSALVVSIHVQVIVESGVVEINLPVSERQTPGNDAGGDLVEDLEGENLTVFAGELTEDALVVLRVHPPKEKEEYNVLVTTFLETGILEDLTALERLAAFVTPRTELIEGAGAQEENQENRQH